MIVIVVIVDEALFLDHCMPYGLSGMISNSRLIWAQVVVNELMLVGEEKPVITVIAAGFSEMLDISEPELSNENFEPNNSNKLTFQIYETNLLKSPAIWEMKDCLA